LIWLANPEKEQMMPEQVFINCMPEDFPLVEEIKKRLELAGLSYYVAPQTLNAIIQNEIVEKIRNIATTQGCMLCLLSNWAIADSAFVSNIQLMCETVKSKKALVLYSSEQLEDDRAIRLFLPQAHRVKASGQMEADLSRLIQSIRQMIHPPRRNLFQFLSEHFSRQVLVRWSVAALMLGVGGSLLYNLAKPGAKASFTPTPTPVVMLVPFSDQSINAGLDVTSARPPENKPRSDPAVEAPFAYKPAVIVEQDDFDKPAFNGDYDRGKWMVYDNRLEGIPDIFAAQQNGVLNLDVAPVPDRQAYLALDGRYMFNPRQVTYLGMRFRLKAYQGKVQDNTFVDVNFTDQFINIPDLSFFHLDSLAQELMTDQGSAPLGTRWHAVEIVGRADPRQVDIYLDGKKIETLAFSEFQMKLWMRNTLTLYVSNTTDWIGMQVDQIIYGAEQPLPSMQQPEQAVYHYTPDKVTLHEDFNGALNPQKIQSGNNMITQGGGVLRMSIPPGLEPNGAQLRFPTRPINENNYYATRYRYTSPADNYWDPWASFQIKVLDPTTKWGDGFDMVFVLFRQSSAFGCAFGLGGSLAQFPFGQYQGSQAWHTLELAVQAPEGPGEVYTGYFWADGTLLGIVPMPGDPARLLNPNTPLILNVNLVSQGYHPNVFSVEVDDLVIGSLSNEKIKE
jgi:hypothetical protein